MSAEQSGPKGYEYQYLKTVYVALRAAKIPKVELIVEPKDGEDAELRIPLTEGYCTIEIQVKSERSALNLSSMAAWLAHFPKLQAERNLLFRLEQDPLRYALFIAQGRCADETQSFCSSSILEEHTRSPLAGDAANVFLEQLANQYGGTKLTKLHVNRHAYCEKQSSELNRRKRKLRQIAQRILVWEQMDEERTREEVIRLLRLKHFIPEEIAKSVLDRLEGAVRKARDSQSDVMPEILSILRQYASQRMFISTLHIDREETSDCLKELQNQHLLLLTGISFCGKTHTAEYIAEHFREDGYTCLRVPGVDDALRFLTDMSPENRLCFLEDPFGGIELNQDYNEAWTKLNSLVSRIGPHRKLIVTSRNDLLQMMTREYDLRKWKVQNHHWYDLTVEDPNLALTVWEAYCQEKQVDGDVRLKITEGLKQEAFLLQPGQLRHLAYEDQNELRGKNRDELEQMARADAVRLGQTFLSKRNLELELSLVVLGICSIPTIGLPEEKMFDLIKKLNVGSIESFEYQIEYLETHGYLECRDGDWRFTHPTYFEAAMFVVEHQGRFQRRYLQALIPIALTSTLKDIPLATIRKFSRLYEKYQNEEIKKTILEQALVCLNHSFPAVRDASLTFAISCMADFDQKDQRTLMRLIETVGFSEMDLEWHNGMPVIKESLGSTLEDFLNYQQRIVLSDEERHDIMTRLAYPALGNFVLPEEAWKVTNYLDILSEEEKTIRYLKQLMTYDESFIRKKAAYFIMYHFGHKLDLAELVFHDEHPSVVQSGIHGCFQGWSNFLVETRVILKERIYNSLRKPAICAASNRFMIKFAKEHDTESLDWEKMNKEECKLVWQLWAELFPVFLDTIPIQLLDVDQPYLFTSIQESSKYLDDASKMRLGESWYQWLDRYLNYAIPQDFGLAIAEFIINHVSSPALRRPLGCNLLTYNDSALAAVSLSEYLSAWNLLSEPEQTDVINLLKSERIDQRWLRAIALTRINKPTMVIQQILEDPEVLIKEPEEWSKILREDLVADGLAVVTGYPSLLNEIGCKETDVRQWNRVLLQVFSNPEHQAFPIALNRVIHSVLSGRYREEELQPIEVAWGFLCTHSESTVKEACFQNLLGRTVDINRSRSKRLWELFFATVQSENYDIYLDRILEVIETISTNCERLSDVFGETVEKQLMSKLTNDLKLVTLVKITENDPEHIRLKTFEEALKQYSPRMFQTCNFLHRKLGVPYVGNSQRDIDHLLKIARSHILDKKIEHRSQFEHKVNLDNWVFKSDKR
ncbi:hypothetical protein [Priestia megaterium]|uniref:nSTAND3 domain-containing NTPase n=1 Tax=Priestia megaterium TaxID=1404 RepID=UPI003D2BF49C